VVSTDTYVKAVTGNQSDLLRMKLLPPNFLLSFSYRPLDNTVLNLLSTSSQRLTGSRLEEIMKGRDSDQKDVSTDNSTDVEKFASMMLLKSTLYLQPELKRYYPLWSNVTSNKLHNLVMMVSNGVISSCMDGYYVDRNPNIVLWDTSTNIGLRSVEMDVSSHLRTLQEQVGIHSCCGVGSVFYSNRNRLVWAHSSWK